MISVVQITTAHSAFDVRIFHKECRSLARAGFDVTLVVPHDDDVCVDDVRIVSLPRTTSRARRMTSGVWRAYRAVRRLRADIFHFHDPELLPLGLLLKLTGRRVIYDVHEDLPRQILHKDWIAAWLRRPIAFAMEVVEQAAARLLDGVVAATPTIGKRFPRHSTAVVQNFPLREEFGRSAGPPQNERPLLLAYIGGIQEVRGAREMVRAIHLVHRHPQARLVMAGEFYPASLEAALRDEPGWNRATFAGLLERREVGDLLSRARIGLILFHPLPNHLEAQPNKLFEYMSAGIPVIASDFPLWREIVSEAECGLLVDPCDPAAVASAIDALLANPERADRMGRAGREAVTMLFNWERESERLIEFYRRRVASASEGVERAVVVGGL